MTRILSLLSLIFGGVATVFWLLSSSVFSSSQTTVERYGVSEGLCLTIKTHANGSKDYCVEDSEGNEKFVIPLEGCLIDTGYQEGRLRFREMSTGREGFIDRSGRVVITTIDTLRYVVREDQNNSLQRQHAGQNAPKETATSKPERNKPAQTETSIQPADLRKMAQDNPFFREAQKVVSGKLGVADSKQRTQILNYCEHLRTAYTTRDIDFLRQVFSEKALIIVGTIVKTSSKPAKQMMAASRVEYNIRTKAEYLARMQSIFAQNKTIDVAFSDFKIMRHPTNTNIYGVSLRQHYKSDRYADEGHLFLLWDFTDATMPVIHVRTWQPTSDNQHEEINLEDFYLQ